MFKNHKTPPETLKTMYQSFLNSSGVATKLNALRSGEVYFALPVYKPKSILKRLLWSTISLFELYTPVLLERFLKTLSLVFKNTPLSRHFIELAEQKINGNSYAPQALEKNASLVVVDSHRFKGPGYLYVPCVKTSLRELAIHHRRQCNIPCIAITGSNGKTTTKELVAAVLGTTYKTTHSTGNFNTELGVCHTVLSLTPSDQIAVIEIGSDGLVHQINDRCKIAQPDLGIITNIGKSHLQGFGDINGVVRIKRQLYDYIVEREGIFFANVDDPYVSAFVDDANNVKTYGNDLHAQIRGEVVHCDPYLTVRWHLPERISAMCEKTYFDIRTNLFGSFNLSNVLAAIAVGCHFDVKPKDIVGAIESYSPDNLRSQIIMHGDISFIVDTYNASPTSMSLALKDFSNLKAPRKIVILGQMLELGEFSRSEHQALITEALSLNFDCIYWVGTEFLETGSTHLEHYFNTVEDLLKFLTLEMLAGSYVFLKGSRGNRLEKILAAFNVRNSSKKHLYDQL